MAWKKPVARIAVRYGAAALASWGILGDAMASELVDDPDVIQTAAIAIAGIAAFATETGYVIAKKFGGDT